ncbi:hypothetical protein RvY_16833 [Ramazzottius varieornatus]|uniref:Uncharacterized protein n=1 Tax=Ramazzottius varieornatus TaxID=947166 RepID=A0A1D1VZZ1_RAMVA|nr:hypothetical protein RvY_16833 [Ramazzottius varieornatus]
MTASGTVYTNAAIPLHHGEPLRTSVRSSVMSDSTFDHFESVMTGEVESLISELLTEDRDNFS